MNLFILSLVLGLSGGCKKPPVKPIEPMKPVVYGTGLPLNIVWETQFCNENAYTSHQDVLLYNNEFIIAPTGATAFKDVMNINANTGQIINNLGICNNGNEFTTQLNNKVISGCNNKVSFYSLDNKQKVFEFTRNIEVQRGDNDFTRFQSQDHVLRSISIQDDSIFMILKSKWQTGIWDTIFRDKKLFKNYEVFNNFTQYWEAPNGDSILVITHSMLERWGSQKNVADMLCYNVKTKQNYWYLPNFTPSGIGGGVVIKDNKLFINGIGVLYCYDLITKQKLWEYYLSIDGDGFGIGDPTPVFVGNLMYTKGSNDYVYCFDKNTGSLIWKSKHLIAGGSKLVLHKGILYCMSRYLAGIKASDGTSVLSTRSPHSEEGWDFTRGLEIDSATDRLYCADARYAYCIDISKYNQ
jgi:outer membrane protein assembly factor BamB